MSRISRAAPPGSLLIRALAVIVPWPRRGEWIAEWEGELGWLAGAAPPSLATRARVWLRACSALPDALWLHHRHGRQPVFTQDLRIALRSLAKRPGYAMTVVLTLGLGIGGATAIFSVVDAVVLRPLPYSEPDRLMELWRQLPSGTSVPHLDRPAIERWREQTEIFTRIEAYVDDEVVVTGVGEPRNEDAVRLTPGLFAMLGVGPRYGRVVTNDDRDHDARVVVVSESFWRSFLGANPDLHELSVILDDERFQVIGVMPREFRFPLGGRSFWLPLDERATDRMTGVARLPSGISYEAARERVGDLAAALQEEQPRQAGWDLFLRPVDDRTLGQRDDLAVWFLGAAVLAVLLIGCVNAANLMLVQASARAREMAIRGALGATGTRLVVMLLTECGVLVTAAAAVGIGVAATGIQVLRAIAPTSYTIFGPNDFILDLRVLAFTATLAVITGVLFAVGPAVISSCRRTGLAGRERSNTGTRAMGRTRAALAVGELTLAMTLLVSASLLLRSFANQMGTDLGISNSGLLVLDIRPPTHRYPDAAARLDLLDRLTDRLAKIPGVRTISAAEDVPPRGGFSFGLKPEPEGGPTPGDRSPQLMPINRVDDRYFDVLEIPLVAGRPFGSQDTPESTPVAVIDVDLATFLWPEEHAAAAVGRRFRLDEDEEWLTVAGIVGNVVLLGLDGQLERVCGERGCEFEVYRPMRQAPRRWSHSIVMRIDQDAARIGPGVKAAVWDVDPSLPLEGIRTIEERLLEELAQPRFILRMVNTFTLVAIVLAVLGVYAVLAYAVAQRAREFGIRMAVGARSGDVLRDVLIGGLAFGGAGVMIGAVAAVAATRILASLLHGLAPTDPVSLAGAALILMGVTVVASIRPAWRATRINPTDVLRADG